MGYKKKRDGDRISWVVIIVGYLLFAPLGVVLLLVKLFGADKLLSLFGVDNNSYSTMREEPLLRPSQRVTVDTRVYQNGQTAQRVDTQTYGNGEASRVKEVYAGPPSENPARAAGTEDTARTAGTSAKEAVRAAAQSPKPKKSNARLLKTVGVIAALWGMYTLLSTDSWNFNAVMTFLAFALGGGAMLLKGHLLNRDMKRYAQYLAIIGDREAMAIDELSRIAGYSKRQVEKDLRQMAENGYFGEGAYLNMELGYLFRNNAADRKWQEKLQKEQADADSMPTGGATEYAEIIQNIRRANRAISDPVLSAKIDELESITRKIFAAVKNDPEKAKRIDKFLTYYLPTTQKLLDSYAQFESAGVEGENLSQAKARIASTMDMILKGFSHQLDELYKADAMDVDTDIRVMENMFRRDTGSFSDDFGMEHPTGNARASVAEDFGLGKAVSGTAGGGSAAPDAEDDDNTAVGYYREASERRSSAGRTGGNTASAGNSGAGYSGGNAANAGNSGQSGKRRFGQDFEEDFGMGGAAYQQMPRDQ